MLTRRILLTLSLALAATGAVAQQSGGGKKGGGNGNDPFASPSAISIAGTYRAQGRNRDGSTYDGRVVIT